MGEWGTNSFENDDAADWLAELSQAEDTTVLREAFSAVTERDDYLELPESSVAVAAAEVVAALRGRPVPGLPDAVQEFVAHIAAPPSSALVSAALRALERVETKSELQELWDETDSRTEWHKVLADLRSRLN